MERLALVVVISKHMDWWSVKAVKEGESLKKHSDQRCLMTKDSPVGSHCGNNVSGGRE